MIRIDSLSFSYREGTFHLSIPELVIEQGEKVAVIGPSGSGKTTLLNLVAGISLPDRGSICVTDNEIQKLSDSQRRGFRISRIGFVFQDFELLDYLSVMDNILHPYRITDALELDSAVRKRAAELAQGMGIGDKLQRRCEALSQGERQRAAICRALLPEPELLLADEATGNLDPASKERILDLLFDHADSTGATLLAVTHDHDLLPRFDRVIDFHQFHAPTPEEIG
ncbi:MAG: ABC transporter ATP-binding protein [Rhodothermales bacterium]